MVPVVDIAADAASPNKNVDAVNEPKVTALVIGPPAVFNTFTFCANVVPVNDAYVCPDVICSNNVTSVCNPPTSTFSAAICPSCTNCDAFNDATPALAARAVTSAALAITRAAVAVAFVSPWSPFGPCGPVGPVGPVGPGGPWSPSGIPKSNVCSVYVGYTVVVSVTVAELPAANVVVVPTAISSVRPAIVFDTCCNVAITEGIAGRVGLVPAA